MRNYCANDNGFHYLAYKIDYKWNSLPIMLFFNRRRFYANMVYKQNSPKELYKERLSMVHNYKNIKNLQFV